MPCHSARRSTVIKSIWLSVTQQISKAGTNNHISQYLRIWLIALKLDTYFWHTRLQIARPISLCVLIDPLFSRKLPFAGICFLIRVPLSYYHHGYRKTANSMGREWIDGSIKADTPFLWTMIYQVASFLVRNKFNHVFTKSLNSELSKYMKCWQS